MRERCEARFREGAVKGGLFWTMKADLLSYAKEMGCYTGCPYDQETDDDLDRLEAKMRGLMLKGREQDEITLLTQLEEPAWRTDF